MTSKRLLAALFTLVVAPIAGASVAGAATIDEAIADGGRPAADTARDADRKPAVILNFGG